MIRALLAVLLWSAAAYAGPLDDCRDLLPNGAAPVYVTEPVHHTELCHSPGYVLSHDDTAHEPRWVGWVVTAEHLKAPHEPRTNHFRADPALPPGAGSRPADYRTSGYDQGHMSDAEDNAWSPATEDASFLLSNMIPQCPACNRQTWRYLENWTRAQAMKHGAVYVLSGPVFEPQSATIGTDRVWVPSASWRLVLDLADNLAWAFIVPNDPAALKPGTDVSPYLVDPAAVERAAGITLPIPFASPHSAPLN